MFGPMPQEEDDTKFFAKIVTHQGVDNIYYTDIQDALTGLRRRMNQGRTIAQLSDKDWGALRDHDELRTPIAAHLHRYRQEHMAIQVDADSIRAQGHSGLASIAGAGDADGTQLFVQAPSS